MMALTKSVFETKQVNSTIKAFREKVPSFPYCFAGTLLGGFAIGVFKWLWRRNSKKEEKQAKVLQVDLEAVHRFYTEIQESPLLYPYFMHLKIEKREDVMQKIACSIHKALGQVSIAREHLEKLKKIHIKMGVDEKAYAEFTKLFAHICCNKSDTQRSRMLKTFGKLQKYICPGAAQQLQTVTQLQGLVDSECRDASGANAGEDETVNKLCKRISDLENLHDYLLKVNKALDARMKVLESNNKAMNA